MTVPVVNVSIKTKAESSTSTCVFSTVILKYNVPLSEQITSINTKYVVKWNFNLARETMTVPEGCIFEFDGGKFMNGTIVWNSTKVHNPYKYTILENITEHGSKIIL